MNLRGAKPVVDNSIKNFINNISIKDSLYDTSIQAQFTHDFYNWINSSTNNKLHGLDKFTNCKLVAGTAQAFDHFYWRHKDRRIRFFKGEFMYHSACLKNGGQWAYLEDASLEKSDAIIISVPFSDCGKQKDINFILHNCNAMGIPVLLDFAYYPCSKNIDINLDMFHCVETVTFSISKAFYGAEFLRVGMRLQRQNLDDGVDVFNSVEMVNRVSLSIASKLINTYSVDHNWNTYQSAYEEVCNELNLEQTDCIMFGLGDEKYIDYNRGGSVNRICISELIGEKINDNSKQS